MGAGFRIFELIHCLGEKLFGADVFACGHLGFSEFAVAFGDLEIAFREGELGAHGDVRVVILFGERLDGSVGAFGDSDHPGG